MKFLNLVIIFILFSSFVLANDTYFYNASILGNSMDGGVQRVSSSALSEDLETAQSINAEGESQLLTSDIVYEIKRQVLLDQADKGWDIIIAYLKLISETIILLMYLVEMRLLLYVFVQLIPRVFIRVRDSVVNFMLSRLK